MLHHKNNPKISSYCHLLAQDTLLVSNVALEAKRVAHPWLRLSFCLFLDFVLHGSRHASVWGTAFRQKHSRQQRRQGLSRQTLL
jgi:hypothetical protein